MGEGLRACELLILKTIAETLNRSHELEPMLGEALEQLLRLTGLTTGWIFLVGDEPDYRCVADCNLPPALRRDGKAPMRRGICWCLGSYWEGRLEAATNIIECKRLEDAVRRRWGDTWGITHHATVPLSAGGRRFGLLNVAAPGKERFGEEELALLQAVALQLGTAIARVQLYRAQRRRAELLAQVQAASRRLMAVADADRLPEEAVRQAAAFGWPGAVLLLREGGELWLRAVSTGRRVRAARVRYPLHEAGPAGRALAEGCAVAVRDAAREPGMGPPPGWPAYRSALAVPWYRQGEPAGVLAALSPGRASFDEVDREALEALAAHVALALENAHLHRRGQELARAEERQRLARDLHDAVSQRLFAIALTARAAREVLPERPEEAALAVERVLELAQGAQREMRALIWQLRPAGLDGGLLDALRRYGEALGLRVKVSGDAAGGLPPHVEEALWRVGQEALSNVRKHAGTGRAEVRLRREGAGIALEVRDRGCGFDAAAVPAGALGLRGMRERAQALGGRLLVTSRPGRGTAVRVWLPCPGAAGTTGPR